MTRWLPISVALVCAGACVPRSGTDAVERGTGARIGSPADLRPDASPGDRAVLVMRGTEVPVKVERQQDGDRLRFRLLAHGEEIEAETYRNHATGFALVEAAGEAYHPEIPLLWFPLNVGDKRKWSGTLRSEGSERKATATIALSEDDLTDLPGTPEALKVTVQIALESGTPTAAKRDLTFWFVDGKGLVKREFGRGLMRRPAKDGE